MISRLKTAFLNNKKIILLAVVLIVIFELQATRASKVKIVPVKTVSVEKRVVSKTISAAGSITSEKEANLSSLTSQRVTTLNVKEGDLVKKGQLLAAVDSTSQVQTAQYYKDARDVAIRQRDLFEADREANTDSLGGEEQYNIKIREYSENVSKAEAQYAAQLALLAGNYIYAPFEGTVVKLNKETGETVIAGETVIQLADLNDLVFTSEVDQEDKALLTPNSEAVVELDSFPGKKILGSITYLPNYVKDAAASTYETKIAMSLTNDILVAYGMTGTVKIVTQQTEGEADALYYDSIYADEENSHFVWTLHDGTIFKTPVEIGLEGDIFTEVKTQINDQIVVPVVSDAEIKDGYKAKVVK